MIGQLKYRESTSKSNIGGVRQVKKSLIYQECKVKEKQGHRQVSRAR